MNTEDNSSHPQCYDIGDVIANETPKISFTEEEQLPPLADEDWVVLTSTAQGCLVPMLRSEHNKIFRFKRASLKNVGKQQYITPLGLTFQGA